MVIINLPKPHRFTTVLASMNSVRSGDANADRRKKGWYYSRSEYVSRATARRSVTQSRNVALGSGVCHPGDVKHDITDFGVSTCALAWGAT